MDVLISSKALLDWLCQEEFQLKKLGLHGQAAGLRDAITILIRLTDATKQGRPSPHAPEKS